MLRLLLEPVNLLILDEPTNHLDMKTKDILKEAIRAFDGTVILVSHDRQFLDGLVDKVYEFGGGRVREHLGGIYDFLQHHQIENLSDLERRPAPSKQSAPQKPAEKMPPPLNRQPPNRVLAMPRKRSARRLSARPARRWRLPKPA